MNLWQRWRGPVRRRGDTITLSIPDEERTLLVRLLGELTQLLSSEQASPVLRRLTPPAYHLEADREADDEYQRLMHDELLASRRSAITQVVARLRAGTTFDVASFDAFVRSLNSVRLVLGTILDVSEDDDLDDLDDLEDLLGDATDTDHASDDPTDASVDGAHDGAHDDTLDERRRLAAERHLYHYLSWLLEASVEALS